MAWKEANLEQEAAFVPQGLTVKAVPMSNLLPIQMYTKNETIETKIGAVVQMSEKHTELTRAGRQTGYSFFLAISRELRSPLIIHCISTSRASNTR